VSFAENDWLRQAQHHDDEAFAHLVETYQTPVYNLCYRMLGNAQEAEDAAQETFWRAYQAINRYDPSRPFGTWLLSIAAHYCIDQQRRKRVPTLDVDLMTDMDAPDPAPQPEKVLGQQQEKEAIARVLENLNEQDRAIIVLRYWQEYSEEEIGQALSLSVSAVKSRLHRARRQLAQLWLDSPQQVALERKHHESPAF
jgi:RNA polymerase sigma-70 factor, ECF subfamily